MKNRALFLLLLLPLTAFAQRLTLEVRADTPSGQKTIDSLTYRRQHENLRSANTELGTLSGNLTRMGYIENGLMRNERTSDSLITATFRLGPKTTALFIYIPDSIRQKTAGLLDLPPKTTIPFREAESHLDGLLGTLERKGYPLARLQLTDFRKEGDALAADLSLDTGTRRQVNDIVINGYDKFPEGFRSAIRRQYRSRTFNRENLQAIKNDFDKFRFASQTKFPEILFTKDTTKVYVYLDKARPNRFEGFVGFSNDEEKDVRFNGYLDLQLVNLLGTGEEFALYWKSDGQEQRTFNAALDLPYIFRSRLGLKLALNIFKQDSTFQNTRTSIDVGYFFRYNLRAYAGYQSSESSDIQNANTATLSDFDNRFFTGTFEYFDYKPDDFLFPEKTRAILKAGTGSRTSKLRDDKQFFASLDARHTFHLDQRNSFFVRTQDFYLSSSAYITNELFRFGGINSIRGFNENSLQGNVFASLLTEYRFRIAPSLYVHSIVDYGHFRDDTTDFSGRLLGLGIGFGILTRNGLLNLVYANGSSGQQQFRLSNSIVHLSFKTNF